MSRNSFTIPATANPHIMMRRFGYAPYTNRQGEQSYVRRVTRYEFPRFHLYIQEVTPENLTCSIHLDQKAPVLKGAHAHAGDYDSPQVIEEMRRLQS